MGPLPAILRLIEAEILPPVNAKWAEEETAQLRKELLVSFHMSVKRGRWYNVCGSGK